MNVAPADPCEVLRDAIFVARQTARYEVLRTRQAIAAWQQLQADRPDEAEHFMALLPAAEIVALERHLDAADPRPRRPEKAPPAERSGSTAGALDDWPGSGDISAFLDTPAPPVAWFVTHRLLADRAHLVAGIGGSSKTRFLYHLGIGGVIGRVPWGWPIARTGSAALLLAEDTEAGVHRTLAAMAAAMQLDDAERSALRERLRVHSLAGRDSRLLTLVSGGALAETHRVDQMLAALRTLPPPLVFVGLDPALALSEGDEGSPAHQRRLGELADRLAIETGACVVLAVHAAKAVQQSDELGSHTSRGSGAITDAVRGEFVLRTMTGDEARAFGITSIEERRAHVQLVLTKANESPPSAFVPLWLRRGAGGVLEPAELEARPADPIGEREHAAVEVLRQLAATGAPRLSQWRQACEAAGLLPGVTEAARKKSMERVVGLVLAAGLVERGIARGVYVPAGLL